MFNLEWYRIFLYTARCGNLTKAAQELHMTQPSVSYAVKRMEEELGLRLFRRLSKGVELTEEGRSLLAYVEQSFALLDAAGQRALDLKGLKAGEIRIGASDSLIKRLLLPELHRFHQEFPGIRIRLSHGKTPEIVRRLKEGQLDLAVVHLPVDDPQLEVRELARLDDCFVVGAAYRELAEQHITLRELAELPLILMSPGSNTREFVERWFASGGLTVQPDIELGSVDLLAEFAGLGFGAAFVTRSFVEEELRAGKLFELRIADALPPRGIGLAVRRGIELSLAAERFAQSLPVRHGGS